MMLVCSWIDSLCSRKPLGWFQRTVYEWDPHFKFPNRIIGTTIISLVGLYTVQTDKHFLEDLVHTLDLQWGTRVLLVFPSDDVGRLQSQ